MNHETETSGTHQHKYYTPYDERVAEGGYFDIPCTLCAGDGDYTPWTKRYVCAFCHVDVTADNIGLTLNFHICDKCIHKDKVLEFLESQSEESEYQGWLDEPSNVEETWENDRSCANP